MYSDHAVALRAAAIRHLLALVSLRRTVPELCVPKTTNAGSLARFHPVRIWMLGHPVCGHACTPLNTTADGMVSVVELRDHVVTSCIAALETECNPQNVAVSSSMFKHFAMKCTWTGWWRQ